MTIETTKTIAKINNVSIVVIENGEKLIPIKPICEALGIAYQSQLDKIKSDEILSSTIMLSMTVGADKKEREMLCIPYMFVFGWLFTINPKNVKAEAQESVKKYRLECYKALFMHFAEQSKFIEEKQNNLNIELDKLNQIKRDFKTTKLMLTEQQKRVEEVRHKTFEEWKAENSQTTIPFID